MYLASQYASLTSWKWNSCQLLTTTFISRITSTLLGQIDANNITPVASNINRIIDPSKYQHDYLSSQPCRCHPPYQCLQCYHHLLSKDLHHIHSNERLSDDIMYLAPLQMKAFSINQWSSIATHHHPCLIPPRIHARHCTRHCCNQKCTCIQPPQQHLPHLAASARLHQHPPPRRFVLLHHPFASLS